jgi:hypothetical protein
MAAEREAPATADELLAEPMTLDEFRAELRERDVDEFLAEPGMLDGLALYADFMNASREATARDAPEKPVTVDEESKLTASERLQQTITAARAAHATSPAPTLSEVFQRARRADERILASAEAKAEAVRTYLAGDDLDADSRWLGEAVLRRLTVVSAARRPRVTPASRRRRPHGRRSHSRRVTRAGPDDSEPHLARSPAKAGRCGVEARA